MAASASKKASNTPAWLKRQKRFHTEFQFPHAAGRARQVMLWTQKECTASRKRRSFRPLAPRRERQARNTSSTVAQSSSVIRVSMVGSSQTDLPSVTDPRTWESTHRILSPIRPHGLVWYETYDRIDEAIAREKDIKKWRRDWKIRLIEIRLIEIRLIEIRLIE